MPVLTFLAHDSLDSNPKWLDLHERQLSKVKRHEIVALRRGHYPHWSESTAMAKKIKDFLNAVSKP
ncbi:hypothetical protein [Arthrobacter sp. A5]|uniref:hypothetical protein n=1 Tax=Arthrobacter sp. A5 TaxID=576926 RepID=UPI003DA8A0CF